MKRNKLFLLALAACTTLLAACSTELETSGNPERAGAGEAIVAVSLHFPGADTPAGYADVPTGVALDLEKEIKDIAFIAFTQGGTGVYLSTNPLLDDRGLTQPLAPVDGQPSGTYTAQFKIKSADLSGNTTLVAIANFKDHGLTFDDPDLTIASLRAMLTQTLETDGAIAYPLLMTVAQNLELTEGNAHNVDFEMERIMARVDVLNSAYEKDHPENRFVLTSARLLSAAAQGTMIGGEVIAAPTYVDLKVQSTVTEVEPAEGAPAGTPVKQQLAPMYLYENTNTDKDGKLSATATSVELKGTYKGKEFHKILPFVTAKKVVEGALTGDEIIPIVRNYRYVVEILSSDENTLDFVLKTTDWAEGKELNVKVDMEAPKVESLAWNSGDVAWDEATLTANITAATSSVELTFTARGVRATDIAVEAVYDENPTKFINDITVEKGDLTGYADDAPEGLSRSYTVKIPACTSELPVGFNVVVFNEKAKTVIHVKHTPLFVADLKSSRTEAIIDPAAQLIDLRKVPEGISSTFSFFATSGSDLTTSIGNVVTGDFYNIATTEDEADPAILAKYGPGKRVTVSYKALSNQPKLATITVTDADATATPKKVYVKCLKKPYYQDVTLMNALNPANTLSEYVDGTHTIYLAINNGDHGKIRYDVINNADGLFTPNFVATYNTDLTSPNWATQGLTATMTGAQDYMGEYNCVRGYIEVTLPTTIKNPAQATLAVGIPGETPITLIPVYPSGSTITEADKAFRPVLVKGNWWAPINIGQSKFPPEAGDPASVGGNIFQWGRKKAFKWDSAKVPGPVASAEAAGDNFITSSVAPYDWLNTRNDKLWNSGTEDKPVKVTENDPCPAGWRVPTESEWTFVDTKYEWTTPPTTPNLYNNSLLTVSGDIPGTKLYFLATSRYDTKLKKDAESGLYVVQWTSTPDPINAGYAIGIYTDKVATLKNGSKNQRGDGIPVRCIQE